jgi:hypothetical protein
MSFFSGWRQPGTAFPERRKPIPGGFGLDIPVSHDPESIRTGSLEPERNEHRLRYFRPLTAQCLVEVGDQVVDVFDAD